MRWSRDTQALLGAWLRTLVMLGLVVAIVAEIPLRGLGGMPSWLNPGGTSAIAGSVAVPPDVPGEPDLAAAAKRKGDKQSKKNDKHQGDKDKSKKNDKHQGDKDKGKDKNDTKGKDKADKKGKDKGKGKDKADKKGKNQADRQGKGTRQEDSQDRSARDTKSSELTLSAAATTPLTFTPVADAQVNEANPTTNFGTVAWLTADGGTDPNVVSYLRFDVSGVSGTVQSAALRLWVRDRGATENGPEVRATDTNWSEMGITWSTRPAPSGEVLDDKGALTGGTWVEYDVTGAVEGDGAVALVLLPQTSDSAVFASREAANQPRLVLTLGDSTPVPTPTSTPTSTPTPTPTPTPSPTPTPTPPAGGSGTLRAAGETTPVHHGGDAADDPAIWIHPTDPGQSTIIGTDKLGGLAVYDLAGKELFYYPDSMPNNVDLRYNFPLGGERVALVVASDTTTDSLRIYRIDPATRKLIPVAARTSDVGIGVAGLCSYVSPATGKYYAFVGDSSGTVQQWELYDNGSGKVAATKVRTLSLDSTTEGCVADDVTGALYIAEEDVAIWKYGAEPEAGRERTRVDVVGSGGHLTADIEGLAIYYRGDGGGYLLASSQGSDAFVVYERGGTNAYVTTFAITAGSVDGVSHTDGLDVTNAALGAAFPDGLFVAQDDRNGEGNQNFKLVPWDAIARSVDPPLSVDTGWDPRRVGG